MKKILALVAVFGVMSGWASEPKIYWTQAHQQLTFGSQGLNTHFDSEVQRIKEWTELVPYQDTCYRDGMIASPGTCEGYHCSQGGSGKSELWDAFYSARQSEKAEALANAIRGVGVSTAEKLVAGDFFHRKPRSWEAFSSELQSAANSGVISDDIVYLVLVKYKADNVANLGYGTGQCTPYSYPCTVYTPGTVPYVCTKYRTETYTRVLDSMVRRVDIDVRNAVLQAFEKDNASVTVAHDGVIVDVGPHNVYQVSVENGYDVSRVRAIGLQRVQVALPREAMRSATLQKQGNQGLFYLSVDSRYLGTEKDPLVVKYRVEACKMNFFSACLGSYKPSEEVIDNVSQADMKFALRLQDKYKYKVVFSLARKGSRWYDENFTDAFETDSIH